MFLKLSSLDRHVVHSFDLSIPRIFKRKAGSSVFHDNNNKFSSVIQKIHCYGRVVIMEE